MSEKATVVVPDFLGLATAQVQVPAHLQRKRNFFRNFAGFSNFCRHIGMDRKTAEIAADDWLDSQSLYGQEEEASQDPEDQEVWAQPPSEGFQGALESRQQEAEEPVFSVEGAPEEDKPRRKVARLPISRKAVIAGLVAMTFCTGVGAGSLLGKSEPSVGDRSAQAQPEQVKHFEPKTPRPIPESKAKSKRRKRPHQKSRRVISPAARPTQKPAPRAPSPQPVQRTPSSPASGGISIDDWQ